MKSFSSKIVDSHAHINMEDFDEDREEVIERAFKEDISAILCPADLTEPERLKIALDFVNIYDNIILASGVHPHQAKNYQKAFPEQLKNMASDKIINAIGEIGLDFHYNFSPSEAQIPVFRDQLLIAQELDLPVIIHSRNSSKEVMESIDQVQFTCGGVLHCFTEDWDMAKKMLDNNFYISFSGILTFPGAFNLREIAKKIPIERLLVETDAPYLTPIPFRGKVKRNEPVYVKETAKLLASLKNIPYEELALRTTKNFEDCFLFEIAKPR